MVLSQPADEREDPADDEDGGHEATAAGADVLGAMTLGQRIQEVSMPLLPLAL